ncbi:RNHCP domain-containing protein [bacterium]|nr:RNHCP domain-containing protein [bacterium]
MTRKFQRRKEDFSCVQCGEFVTGNGYTNHCPHCLWSVHVDINPGDRASPCGAPMKPITLKPKTGCGFEGARILHRCERCRHEKWNEVARNDSSEALLTLL